MKIGILTFHNSNNYGAVLQCFVLMQYLMKQGRDVEIIDYRCSPKNAYYKICQMSRHRSIKGNISALLDIPFLLKKRQAFDQFRKQYYRMSAQTYIHNDQLRLYCPWEYIIVGSDQVWNDKNTGGDHTYLLDFVEDRTRKIAYAASFGKNQLDAGVKESYKSLLSDIERISVRERSGAKLVEELTGNCPSQVLDPTFLFDKEEWLEYAAPIRTYKHYVLLYTIENSKEIVRFTKEVANRLGCKVIRIADITMDFIGYGKVVLPSPMQFVSLIDKAMWVVTDSYHGTIFSINFNKSFYVFPQASKESNERIRDILTQMDLTKRIVERGEKLHGLETIDYKRINKQLAQYRVESKAFLKESLDKEQDDKERKTADEN